MSVASKVVSNDVQFKVQEIKRFSQAELASVRKPISDEPLVSVLISCYNTGRFLEKTLESVLTQSYKKIEVILFDGASTDNTLEILQRIGAEDPRLDWISEPDSGEYEGFAKAQKKARGEIIKWTPADDLWEKDAVEYTVDYFKSNPNVDMIYGESRLIDELGREIGMSHCLKPFDKNRLLSFRRGFIPSLTVAYRDYVLHALGLLRTDLHNAGDLEYWLRIASAGFEIRYVPKVLGSFRWHGENASILTRERHVNEVWHVSKAYCNDRLQRISIYFRLFIEPKIRRPFRPVKKLIGFLRQNYFGSRNRKKNGTLS